MLIDGKNSTIQTPAIHQKLCKPIYISRIPSIAAYQHHISKIATSSVMHNLRATWIISLIGYATHFDSQFVAIIGLLGIENIGMVMAGFHYRVCDIH